MWRANIIRSAPSALVCISCLLLCSAPPRALAGRRAQPGRDPHIIQIHEDEPADRGSFPPGEVVTRKVTIENVSGLPITLAVLRTSCPCTIGQLGKPSLEAGESTTLRLETRSAEVADPQWYTADVEAVVRNKAGLPINRQQVTVAIGYTSNIEFAVHPHMVSMNAVVGQTAIGTIWIRRVDRHAFQIDDVATPGDWVKVKSIAPVDGAPHIVAVTLEAHARQAALLRGAVTIKIAGRNAPLEAVDISLRTRTPLAADPPGAVWNGRAEPGGDGRREIVLTPSNRAASGAVPTAARVAGATPGVVIDGLRQDARNPSRWRLMLHLDRAKLGSPHGQSSIEITDAAGALLATLPVVWFDGASLWPPK